jgi:hypothetical protein
VTMQNRPVGQDTDVASKNSLDGPGGVMGALHVRPLKMYMAAPLWLWPPPLDDARAGWHHHAHRVARESGGLTPRRVNWLRAVCCEESTRPVARRLEH